MAKTNSGRVHRGVEINRLDPVLCNPINICALCLRMARGFFYKPKNDKDAAHIPACSMNCQDGISAICEQTRGKMPDLRYNRSRSLSNMEKKAIVDTRMNFYLALKEMGLDQMTVNCKPEHIDWVILQVWEGLRNSMQTQSLQGEIPF